MLRNKIYSLLASNFQESDLRQAWVWQDGLGDSLKTKEKTEIMFWVSTLLRGRVLSSFFSSSVCLLSLCLLAGCLGGGGDVNVHCDCNHTVCSLALPHMLRCCTFSCTSTRTSCYAAALHFHTYVMLRCPTPSGMLTFVWTWRSHSLDSSTLIKVPAKSSKLFGSTCGLRSGGSRPAQRCSRSWDSWQWMYKSWISGCACDCLKQPGFMSSKVMS